MPHSPTTPSHSRNSSVLESLQGSPEARRYSKSSLHDQNTPLQNGLPRQDSMDLASLNSGAHPHGNGMGNLADELADAFSDSSDGEQSDVDRPSHHFAASRCEDKRIGGPGRTKPSDEDNTTPIKFERKTLGHSLETPVQNGRGHQRSNVSNVDYDGSDYGSESDMDPGGMSPTLISKVDAVASLARRGTESYGTPEDDPFRKLTDGLRDLSSQSMVEGSASRLITAHSALTTHLTHQTRQLHSLTFPLLSPLAPPPDNDTIELLVPLLVSLSDAMPRPSTSALSSLATLHSTTTELAQTLSFLSDTLHMSRQTTATATRRLKSARELVSEMRRDDELREEGEVWLSRGNWSERLQKRECAGVCGEVIGGFEDVCNGWRQRLLAQADAQA